MWEKGFWTVLFCLFALVLVEARFGHSLTPLPKPVTDGKVSVEKAIQERRTIRDFKEKSLSLPFLSQLLWAAQGITDPTGGKRSAPSAGALYPLDIYIIIGKEGVEGLGEGVYHYLPEGHSISQILRGDRRKEVALACLWQMWMARAPVMFVVTAEYKRITGKYGDRGIRYTLIEAGHVAQNLFLQAEALGMEAGIVGAFQDKEVLRILGAPSQHEPLLIMPVGYKR